jgi:peptidoglycan/xylan/chitin deacetylase (PgdA/CDA1 family)
MNVETTKLPLWKAGLLHLYYHGSWPIRWSQNWLRSTRGRAPIMVLFYHRIAPVADDPWTCSNKVFVRQIRWLRAHFDLVSLTEAQQRIRRGENDRPCVSITFDDGYADNCREALPLLIREQVPCTYFVTVRNVFEGEPFPHDVARGKPLQPNSIEELKSLAASGIEIGAHTRTHADLGRVADPQRLYDEIVVAGEDLQQALDTPIRYFAFPYGHPNNMSAMACRIAHDAGYEGICSAYGGFNFPGDDAFHLQRIPVDNDLIRLKNWTTVDPRKERTPRFKYQCRPHALGPCGVYTP